MRRFESWFEDADELSFSWEAPAAGVLAIEAPPDSTSLDEAGVDTDVAAEGAEPLVVAADDLELPEPVSGSAPAGAPDRAIGAALEDGSELGGRLDGIIDAQQILRDRPDVFAAYYRDYFGPNNDRNSPAWEHRVGGHSVEDYALYWYRSHGAYEGYAPKASSALGAPAEWTGYQGRTTIDGIPLAKILEDRPDVFRAFFTEYYGANNDRNSDAWVDRVGGVTVEDYANYWYNAHGRLEGYRPAVANRPEPAGSADVEAAADEAPADDAPAVETPADDGAVSEAPIALDPSLEPGNGDDDAEPGRSGVEPADPGLEEAMPRLPGQDEAEAEPGPLPSAAAEEPFFWSDGGSPMLKPSSTSMFDPDPIG